MKQTDFMNKIIDARCYFTNKCKISPRVICLIQIFLPQLYFEQGVICCDVLVIFLTDTSRYNDRQIHLLHINGIFCSMLAYLLHTTVIGRITFSLKMVCFLSILAFYFTLIIQTKQDSIIKWYEFVNVQLLHHAKNIDK